VPPSPSRARIALSAYLEDPPSQGFDIYIVNADGSGLVNLTDSPARDMYPDWSADGNLIAFCSDQEGPSQIFLMRPDGTEIRRLTTAIDDCGNPSWSTPIWSPDGEWIAISSAPGGTYPETPLDIFLVRADGSEVLNLTDHPANEGGASWSPDSTRLAFTSDRDRNEEIYVENVDGSALTRLTENPARDGAPAWSPDGAKIVFVSNRDGNWEVYSITAVGSDVARLTNDPGSDLNPVWSPDGRQIAFTSDRSGNGEIYRMDPDGGNVVNLTNSPEREAWFAWAPDGESLAVSTCTGDCLSADTRWSTWRIPIDGSPRVEILAAACSFTWEP
jgi:Tol biopolymer transport system component